MKKITASANSAVPFIIFAFALVLTIIFLSCKKIPQPVNARVGCMGCMEVTTPDSAQMTQTAIAHMWQTTSPTVTITNTPLQGSVWTGMTASATFTGRENHTCIVYNNNMWVIGGYNGSSYLNDVWYSGNGKNWTNAAASAAFSGRSGHTSAVFNNEMWVIGGFDGNNVINDVWYSSDGANWGCTTTAAAFSPRYGHTSVVFNNRMWVIAGDGAGYLDDVWYSSDGANWSCATTAAPFHIRAFHTSVIYNNEMWVMGGQSSSFDAPVFSDVWYSGDGINWTCALASGSGGLSGVGYGFRYSHTSVVYNNEMWIIAGDFEFNYSNDIYHSSDGTNWYLATLNAAFSPRMSHASVIYNNTMWVIGGINGNYLNDVWWAN